MCEVSRVASSIQSELIGYVRDDHNGYGVRANVLLCEVVSMSIFYQPVGRKSVREISGCRRDYRHTGRSTGQ